MNKFDKFIKEKIQDEKENIPESVKNEIESVLEKLPEKESKTVKFKIWPKIASVAAGFAFVCLVLLPNVSSVYANAIGEIPIISDFVEVITVRKYFYSDKNHEKDINVPKIEGENGDAADYINKDVNELTKILSDRFDQDLKEIGDEGHSSIYVDYEVVSNTSDWFTLKIQVFEAAGSSNTYYKYYHIDKKNGKIVTLGDLAESDDMYTALEDEIKNQMRNAMKENTDLIYWVDDSPIGWDFTELDPKHNFYWDKNGDIVIAFDKYEAAPGFMGTPEFTVKKELIKDHLKPEYR